MAYRNQYRNGCGMAYLIKEAIISNNQRNVSISGRNVAISKAAKRGGSDLMYSRRRHGVISVMAACGAVCRRQ